MRELRTEIKIEAPMNKVWDLLMDFESWKEWNPIVNGVSGTASLGSQLNIIMRRPNGKDGQKYSATVTRLIEPKAFRWRAKMIAEFLFTNDKVLELEETDYGTRLVHSEFFSGALVSLFWGKLNAGVKPMLNSMNEGLKKLAEK